MTPSDTPVTAAIPPRIAQLLNAAWEDVKPVPRAWGNPVEARLLVERLTRSAVTLNALNSSLAQAPAAVRRSLLPALTNLRNAVLALEKDVASASGFLDRCLTPRVGYSPEGWRPAAAGHKVTVEG